MPFKKYLIKLTSLATFCSVSAFAQVLPDDEYISELYQYSCMACHASEHSGAPMTQDAKAWAPRVKKGLDTLMDNTINGYKGMPALGSCSDCGAEDFEELIIFMSGIKSGN